MSILGVPNLQAVPSFVDDTLIAKLLPLTLVSILFVKSSTGDDYDCSTLLA